MSEVKATIEIVRHNHLAGDGTGFSTAEHGSVRALCHHRVGEFFDAELRATASERTAEQ